MSRVALLVAVVFCNAGQVSATLLPGLYGTEINGDTLFRINLNTGSATTIGVLSLPGPPQIESLAYNADNGSFFGIDNSNHTLVEISLNPVNWTLAHTLPLATYSNFARNPITGIYYTHVNHLGTLATVNPLTGVVNPVGPASGAFLQSLAFDATGRLFGIGDIPAPGGETLYELDVTTGDILSNVEITSNLTNPRFDNSLAIHPITGAFYSVAAIEGSLYEIDPVSGNATRIGNTGLSNIRSLDFVPIPEPTTFALASLCFSLVAWKRRR